jgi:hypothetical protein
MYVQERLISSHMTGTPTEELTELEAAIGLGRRGAV